jgi:uncharacterized membrane protein
MAEFESLATEESLTRHVARHHYDRLIMLSDGIFAIATTLAALEIHLPEHAGSLAELLSSTGRMISAYGLSFLVIGVFWISNRDLFARLKRVDAGMTTLTLAMLCAVAVIPACAHIVYIRGSSDPSFQFYALVMMACGFLNLAMWGYGAYRAGLMRDEVSRNYRVQRVAFSVTMPFLFGVFVLMPNPQAMNFIAPVLLVVLVARRIIIPRYFPDTPEKP